MFIKVKCGFLYALALPNIDSNGEPISIPFTTTYKTIYSSEATAIESINKFRTIRNDALVLPTDKLFKLSLKEYIALSSKLIEKNIIFDKRKNCFSRCLS